MPSLRFPDNGSRYVFLPNGRPAVNARIYYYADQALTVPAEIYADVDGVKGALVAADVDGRVSLRLDAFGGQRSFWGPVSGQDRLWVVINGVVSAVDADYNARIDGVETRITVIEGTIVDSGDVSSAVAAEAALRVSGDADVTSAAAADASSKASAAQSAAISAAAADATSKVADHTAASDPHGDRAAAASDATSKANAAQAAAQASSLQKTANLSDLGSSSTARTNLGIGNLDNTADNAKPVSGPQKTYIDAGDAAVAFTAAQAYDASQLAAQKSANLADLANTSTARTNLGLGDSATRNVGTGSGNVAAGNDSRLSDARTPTAHASSHASGGSDPLTVAQSQVSGLSSTLAAKADLVGGLVPSSQIPPSSATYRGEVASEAAMLALPAVKNDYTRRTDTDPDTFWTLIGNDPTVLGNWLQTSSAGAVSSVNSQSGTVVLGPADVGAVPTGRTVSTTAPLTGGGALSGNLTLGVTVGTTSGTVAAGDAPAAAQAYAVQRGNHTGTQSADTLTDGTTNKSYTTAEKTKLAGVATGATANATDAQLRDRATHTGAQAISTVTGLQTALDGKPALTGYSLERAFNCAFPGAANEKIDLYFTGDAYASIEVTIVGVFGAANAGGVARAVYGIAGTSTGTVLSNTMTYTVAQGNLPTHFGLSPLSWDAANSRWKISVVHRTTSANSVSMTVRWQGNTVALTNSIRDSIGISALYTTDATTVAAPAVTQGARLTTTSVKTGAYTAAANELVPADATSAGFAVTLPAAATAGVGAVVVVGKADATANLVTVQRTGSDTINSAATSVTLRLADEAMTFTSDGTSKWTISAGRSSLPSLDARYSLRGELETTLPSLDYTGVTDATAAINAALVTGASVVTSPGTLAISGAGVIVPPGVNFDSSRTTFVYTGSAAAFTVAENNTNQSNRIVSIGKVRRSSLQWFAGTDTTSIGVRLLNCNWNTLNILECLSFETGVLVEGNNNGACYNNIALGRIAENRQNIRFLNVGTGYGNSNNFYGGTLRVSSNVAWNGTDGVSGPTASVMLNMATAGNGNSFFGTTMEAGNCWRTFRIGVTENHLFNCRYEQARAGGCEFVAGSFANMVIGGYDNLGPGSAIFNDLGQNTIIGNRGIRMYSDTAGGTPFNGGLAAYEAQGISGAADVLYRSREFGGKLRWEQNARGQSRHYTGNADYPVLLIDPTTLAPLSGGGYSAGRGNADPDICFGRSPANQAAWISNAPILRKTSATTLAVAGALTITANVADAHIVTLQANATSTTISSPATTAGWEQVITLELVQDATGSRTWVAPANVRWAGATAPVLSTGANRRDIFTLRYDSGLTAWVEVFRSINVG